MEKEFLTAAEAGYALGVTANRIYQLVKAGEIPSVRIGGAVRIPKALWDGWVAAQVEKARPRTG